MNTTGFISKTANGKAPAFWLTPLIGRQAETQCFTEWLRDPQMRLIAVVGPGGIGKTSFVLNSLQPMSQQFSGGLFCLSLDDIINADELVTKLGSVFSVHCTSYDALLNELSQTVNRPTCLVIDSAEFLPSLTVVIDLLVACPHLKIVLTSRVTPSLSKAYTLELQPLTLPDLERLHDGYTDRMATALQSEAVQLFLQAAQSVQPGFELTAANVLSIAEICHRLDGSPLAIQLASERLRLMTPVEIAAHLQQPNPASLLDLLVSDHQDVPLRQRSLRQSVDWSYQQLSDHQRDIWKQVALFESGLGLQRLETLPVGEGAVNLDDVATLVTHHVLHRAPAERSSQPPVFTLTRAERAYAHEQLAADDGLRTAQAVHAQHYVNWLQELELRLIGSEQQTWLDQIEAEQGDIEQAIDATLAQSNLLDTLRLGSVLGNFWRRRSLLSQGRRVLDRILAQVDLEAVADTEHDYEFRQMYAKTALNAGTLARFQADYHRASEFCRRAQALFESVGDSEGVLLTLNERVRIAIFQGGYPEAETLLRQGVQLARELKHSRYTVEMVSAQAYYALMYGDLDTAETLLQECLETYIQHGDVYYIAYTIGTMGIAACERGDYRLARRLLEEGRTLNPNVVQRRSVWMNSVYGELVFQQREVDFSNDLYHQAILNGLNLGEYWYVASCLEALARSAATTQQYPHATKLLGAAEAIRQRYQVSRPAYRHQAYQGLFGQLQTKLDDRQFQSARRYGQQMAFINLTAVLEVDAPLTPTPTTPSIAQTYSLTSREQDVMHLLARGLTDGEIGLKLSISPRTVNAHLRSIYAKLEVNTRTAAVTTAFQHGLL